MLVTLWFASVVCRTVGHFTSFSHLICSLSLCNSSSSSFAVHVVILIFLFSWPAYLFGSPLFFAFSCNFISCLYVQRCIFYSDLFIWYFFLSRLCSRSLVMERWYLQVYTCIFFSQNEAKRWGREREKSQLWANVIASIVQTMYFICFCVQQHWACPLALQHTLCLHHQHCWTMFSLHTMQQKKNEQRSTTNKKTSEKLDDEQKKNKNIVERDFKWHC